MKILLGAPVSFDRITYFISDYFIGLARALMQLGHHVRLVKTTENIQNPFIPNCLHNEFITLRRHLRMLIDFPHDLLLIEQLWREVEEFKPDIMLLHVIDTSFLPMLIPRIRGRGTRVLVWLGVHPSQVSRGVHSLLRNADRTLLYDRSYQEFYKTVLNIDNLLVLPLGCDVERFDSVVPDVTCPSRNAIDVCFVGLFDKHREHYLRALTDFNLGIWSWNISDFDTPLKKISRGCAYGEELIRIYKSSKIVLNIHRDFERRGGNYRLFEIAAAGAFQLVDDREGLGEYFEPGKEMVTFSDENDLRTKVAYYLENEEERLRIAQAGYDRVCRDHTLKRRMEYLLNRL